MNKILTLVFLLSFTFSNSQNKSSFSDLFSFSASYEKANLTFRNGDTLSGIAKINIKNEIVFKKNKKDQKTIYDYRNIAKIILDVNHVKKTYVYKIIDGRQINRILLLNPQDELGKGKLKLFTKTSVGTYNTGNMNGTGIGFYGTSTKTTYFLSTNNNDIVTDLRIGNTYSKRFKKIAKKYFKSCPDLLKKINNKYFKRYGIKSVVEYYNLNCGN